MSEKNLPASQQKLEKARKDGQVSISQEAAKLAVYAAIFEVIHFALPYLAEQLHGLVSHAIEGVSQPSHVRMRLVIESVKSGAVLSASLSLMALVLVVFAIWPQSRFVIAPKALTKGFDKLNPGANLKNYLSADKALMLVLGPLKIGAIAWVAIDTIRSQMPDLMRAFEISSAQFGEMAAAALRSLELRLLLVFLLLAMLDIVVKKKMFLRRQRMDLKDMKDEHKQSSGDPHMRAEHKERRREIVEEPMRVGQANAVVVNPTHIAIALWYDAAGEAMPVIVAKGSGEEAEKIRRNARDNRVPIVKYVGLARRLYALGKVGSPIPAGTGRATALLYTAVAEVTSSTRIPLDDRLHLAEVDPVLGDQMMGVGQVGPVGSA